jgi:hydrogenase expression/formation protein HypE
MNTESAHPGGLACPVPASEPTITMAHGGGGRLMHELIERIFLADPSISSTLHDGAVTPCHSGRLAFTTDSFVVRPLFFPGGDIGSLAVYGTVNDLAMCGALPDALSVGVILEEGFPISDLTRIVRSMRAAAHAAGVRLLTGDTKVVEHGHGDGIYINTSGIGWVDDRVEIAPARIRPGDAILVSGDLGRHGIALMAVREGLRFECPIVSDCSPLHAPVLDLLAAGIPVHCLRDLTRGGLASALVELADASGCRFQIDEGAIAVADEVRGACEILGLDPLHIANEGRFCAFVPADCAERALAILSRHPVASGAGRIGTVSDTRDRLVVLRTVIGTERIIDMPTGELLPRIC